MRRSKCTVGEWVIVRRRNVMQNGAYWVSLDLLSSTSPILGITAVPQWWRTRCRQGPWTAGARLKQMKMSRMTSSSWSVHDFTSSGPASLLELTLLRLVLTWYSWRTSGWCCTSGKCPLAAARRVGTCKEAVVEGVSRMSWLTCWLLRCSLPWFWCPTTCYMDRYR